MTLTVTTKYAAIDETANLMSASRTVAATAAQLINTVAATTTPTPRNRESKILIREATTILTAAAATIAKGRTLH